MHELIRFLTLSLIIVGGFYFVLQNLDQKDLARYTFCHVHPTGKAMICTGSLTQEQAIENMRAFSMRPIKRNKEQVWKGGT